MHSINVQEDKAFLLLPVSPLKTNVFAVLGLLQNKGCTPLPNMKRQIVMPI